MTFPPNNPLIRDLQFHFANILSPWIRRSLVAAGFGTGHRENSGVRHEVAPVTRYHDQYIADPRHCDDEAAKEDARSARLEDPEAIIETPTPSSSRSSSQITIASVSEVDAKLSSIAPIMPVATPFFHFDIAAAVRAAESGIVRTRRSYNTFPEKE